MDAPPQPLYALLDGRNQILGSAMRAFYIHDIPFWLTIYEDATTIANVETHHHSTIRPAGSRAFHIDIFTLNHVRPVSRFLKQFFEPMDLLRISPFLIRYMKTPPYVLQFFAVELNPHSLAYICPQTEAVCIEAVRKNGLVLRDVRIQTTEICLEAVKQNGMALAYLSAEYWTVPAFRNEYEKICKEAVNQNGNALGFVRIHRSPALCMLAVQQTGYALMYIPPEDRTADICAAAVARTPQALEFTSPFFRTWRPIRIDGDKDCQTVRYL